MSSRVSLIVRMLVVVAAALALLLMGTSQATAVEEGVAAGDRTAVDGTGGGSIQATERISIPYGFSDILSLADDGGSIAASGQGACTADQAITIAFTVTQSTSGASVTGLWDGTCTGEVQTWTNTPAATPSPNFSAGAAEACAFAETRDDGSVTDSQDWCDDVLLASHRLFLPHIHKP